MYEFICKQCLARSSILVRHQSEVAAPTCLTCHSQETERVFSTFAYHRSPDIPESEYYKDPGNIGRWTERRFKELGLDIPPEVSKSIEAARQGEIPEAMKEEL